MYYDIRITDKTYQIVETGKKPHRAAIFAKINQVLEKGLIYKPEKDSPTRLEGLRAVALDAGVRRIRRINRLIHRQPKGHMSDLPDELMMMVLGHLGSRDLRAAQVDTETQRLTADVWLTLAREFGYFGSDVAQAKAYMKSLDHNLILLRPHLEKYQGSDLEASLRNLKSITAEEIFHFPECYTVEFAQFLCKILRDRKIAPMTDFNIVDTLSQRLMRRHSDFHDELLIRLGANPLDSLFCHDFIDEAIRTTGCLPILQACIDCVPKSAKVLLRKAAAAGKADIVRYLLHKDPKNNGADNRRFGRTALHAAAKNGRLAICQILIDKGAFVDPVDYNGETPLHLASLKGHEDVARLLLKNGANVYARCKVSSSTPLHLARSKEVMQTLLEWDADLHATDDQGRTPLHSAALNCNRELNEFLLDQGSDLRAKNNWGSTPLMTAISAGAKEDAALFLERGADPNDTDNKGRTALHSAVNNLNPAEDEARVQLLLRSGARVDIPDMNGETSLQTAIRKNVSIRIIQLLEKAESDRKLIQKLVSQLPKLPEL